MGKNNINKCLLFIIYVYVQRYAAERRIAFRDTVVLDYDFQPKILQFRENEQMRFAAYTPAAAGITAGIYLFTELPESGRPLPAGTCCGIGRRDRSSDYFVCQLLERKYYFQGFSKDMRRFRYKFIKIKNQRIIGFNKAETE